jgi:prepilin-type processing-associated H-X9-DG protein
MRAVLGIPLLCACLAAAVARGEDAPGPSLDERSKPLQNDFAEIRKRIASLEQETAALREEVRKLKATLQTPTSTGENKADAASSTDADGRKRRLAQIMKEIFSLQTQAEGSPGGWTPATTRKAQELGDEAEALIKGLSGEDQARREALLEEIVNRFAPELKGAVAAAKASALQAACANNLAHIGKGLQIYRGMFGKESGYPPHTGQTFLLCLAGKCGKQNLHPREYFEKAPLKSEPASLFKCPATKSRSSLLDYLGPRKQTPAGVTSALAEGMRPDTPVAADKKGHHPHGGNVLFLDGSVKFLRGEEYEAAIKQLE